MADKTRNVPLSAEQEQWYATACERLNPERLKKVLLNLIDIHSPTGAERQASEFIATYMREHLGEHSRYQAISEDTGNAIGELRGSGGGASLLLYAPIDSYRWRSGKGPAVGRPDFARRHVAEGFRERRSGLWPWRRQSEGNGREPG